jgi:hypothetical protein
MPLRSGGNGGSVEGAFGERYVISNIYIIVLLRSHEHKGMNGRPFMQAGEACNCPYRRELHGLRGPSAQQRLENAQTPISKLEQIRLVAVVQEAAELRAETTRLRAAHNSEIADWVNSGSEGDRPAAPVHLVAAEKRPGEIVAGMGDAETQLAIAREGSATAASASTLCMLRSVPFGKYWRSNPLVFSFVPRCQGLCGSQK